MDMGYMDFARLYRITTCGAFFVARLKRRYSLPRNKASPGILILNGSASTTFLRFIGCHLSVILTWSNYLQGGRIQLASKFSPNQ